MAVSELLERVQNRRRLPEPQLRRLIRQSAGISLADVADALGVTRSAVSRWETGDREPRDASVEAYADLLARLASSK
jgi:transcriptional regulator with XRE-family HTH domain